MKDTKHVSVHFTMKGQDLKQDFFIPLANTLAKLRERGAGKIVLHNSFLTKEQCEAKGFDITIPTVLNALADEAISYSNDEFDFEKSRKELVEAMKEKNPKNSIAYVFGDVKEGVEIEHNLLRDNNIAIQIIQRPFATEVIK